jgi:hypothetical protein
MSVAAACCDSGRDSEDQSEGQLVTIEDRIPEYRKKWWE